MTAEPGGALLEARRPRSVVGSTVGQYEVLDEIGRGGMGVVYRARQRGLERLVALKALHVNTPLGGAAGSALIRESRLAGALSHPNIVTVYEYLEEGETPYVAMEYVPRGSLRPWMTCMTLAQFVGVIDELLAGLAAVAPSGIVHRDLKPENVMVTGDGRVKIADFGIAKATQRAGGHSLAVTPTGVTVGTPAYMSPEQALCEEVGPWSDLYSIGIMAYEHLVGAVPFRDARTPMAMLLAHVKDPIVPPVELVPQVDPGVSSWVMGLLEKDPAKRTRSAAEAWEALEDIVIGRLGPMWRRDARLTERARPARISPRRLDPTQFASQRVTVAGLDTPDPIFTLTPLLTPATMRSDDRPTRRMPAGRLSLPRRGALMLAAVAAGVAGFLLTHGGGSRPASRPRETSSVDFGLDVPAGWYRAAGPARIAGYRLHSALELIAPRTGGRMTVGLSRSPTAALLAPGVAHASGAGREVVSLGGKEFFRFRNVTLAGGAGNASIYTLPTTTGVLVAACGLPASGGERVEAGCEGALASLRLASGEPLPTQPVLAYLATLDQALDTYGRTSRPLLRQLRADGRSGQQAEHAGSLAKAASAAASALEGAMPGPSEKPLDRSIIEQLGALAAGFEEMEKAAKAEDASGYRKGRGEAETASRALRSELAALQ